MKKIFGMFVLATVIGGALTAGGCTVVDEEPDGPDTTIINPPDSPDVTITPPAGGGVEIDR